MRIIFPDKDAISRKEFVLLCEAESPFIMALTDLNIDNSLGNRFVVYNGVYDGWWALEETMLGWIGHYHESFSDRERFLVRGSGALRLWVTVRPESIDIGNISEKDFNTYNCIQSNKIAEGDKYIGKTSFSSQALWLGITQSYGRIRALKVPS